MKQFSLASGLILGYLSLSFSNFAAQAMSQQELSLIEQKADQGSPDAQYNLGILYYSGKTVGKNTKKAKEYFQQAFKNNLQNACDIYPKIH